MRHHAPNFKGLSKKVNNSQFAALAAGMRRKDLALHLGNDVGFTRFLVASWNQHGLFKKACKCLSAPSTHLGRDLNEKEWMGQWYQYSVKAQFTDRTAASPLLDQWKDKVASLQKPLVKQFPKAEEKPKADDALVRFVKSSMRAGQVWSVPMCAIENDGVLFDGWEFEAIMRVMEEQSSGDKGVGDGGALVVPTLDLCVFLAIDPMPERRHMIGASHIEVQHDEIH